MSTNSRFAQGQKDGAKGYGNHNKPHSSLTIMTSGTPKKDIATNKEYNAGHRHATNQRTKKS